MCTYGSCSVSIPIEGRSLFVVLDILAPPCNLVEDALMVHSAANLEVRSSRLLCGRTGVGTYSIVSTYLPAKISASLTVIEDDIECVDAVALRVIVEGESRHFVRIILASFGLPTEPKSDVLVLRTRLVAEVLVSLQEVSCIVRLIAHVELFLNSGSTEVLDLLIQDTVVPARSSRWLKVGSLRLDGWHLTTWVSTTCWKRVIR